MNIRLFSREYDFLCMHINPPVHEFGQFVNLTMGWLRLVGSFKLHVSFVKEPYKRDDILQKRPIILRSLLIVATPNPAYVCVYVIYLHSYVHKYIYTYL